MALDNGRQKIAAVNRLGLHYSAFAKSTGLEPSRINHLAKQKSAKPEKSSLNRLSWVSGRAGERVRAPPRNFQPRKASL